ncbi:conserved hypothetical protein [Sporisorium reilianum SRZ2]|uniref:Palmitoyltransferase n=1 Tax=Sporisorium reilianum (strain SRZ2) TaxID=999809 RepID=E6ZZB4_SPORE|nr:conserved hypothetical protein [Sporisorium reilianum SRZ2]
MSLRQRPARPSSDPATSASSDPPNAPPTSSNHGSAARKRIRLNRVLGRIVPIILLVYIAYAYDLVVIRYAYRFLHVEQKRTLVPILWLLPTHALFVWSLRAYLRVFFAHDAPPTSGAADRAGVLARLRARLGATFPDPDQAQQQDEQRIAQAARALLQASGRYSDVRIELCQPDGEPQRCWRDSCNGRLKMLRTRHCGDCGTCRVGFDHHCAWFDNDVSAAATLRPFVAFLLSIPPLYTLALAPLFSSAWRVLVRIHSFASSDAGISGVWWSQWYSWLGGPAFRWMVGFGLGASRWSRATPATMPHESPRAPVIVALGAVFTFVASALATSSLTHLRHAKLTVDVERAKAIRGLQRRLESAGKSTDSQTSVAAIQQRIDALAPVQHFRVSWADRESAERRSRVVSLLIEEGLLSHGGPWTNVRRLLRDSVGTSPGWALSGTALRRVLEKAALLTPAQ